MIKTKINKEDLIRTVRTSTAIEGVHFNTAKKWELESSSPGELPEKVTRKKKRK